MNSSQSLTDFYFKTSEEYDPESDSNNSSTTTTDRINQLKAILRHNLYNEQSFISAGDILSEEEHKVCVLIFNLMKPYIPAKKDQFVISHQLPLAILCNDILSYTGNAKHTRKLCPSINFSSYDALRFNARSLYHILRHPFIKDHTEKDSTSMIVLHAFDGSEINSEGKANSNRDATFNGVFDLGAVTSTCESRNLRFAHNIIMMPGGKTVQILGTRITPRSKTAEQSTDKNYKDAILSNPIVIQQSQKSVKDLKKDVSSLGLEIKEARKVLQQTLKLFQKQNFGKIIKQFKSLWSESSNRPDLYRQIEEKKKERADMYVELNNCRKTLKDKRQLQHYMRMAIRYGAQIRKKQPKQAFEVNRPKLVVGRHGHGIAKSEDCTIDSNCNLYDDITIGATDNGLITMTDTISFGYSRFKFHLDLYNYYATLQHYNEEEIEKIATKNSVKKADMLKLPASFKIKNGDVDVASGQWRLRRKLTKAKKGASIKSIEKDLSQCQPLLASPDVDTFESTLGKFKAHSKNMRSFYTSNAKIKAKRHADIKYYKYKHSVCSDERKYCIEMKGKIEY